MQGAVNILFYAAMVAPAFPLLVGMARFRSRSLGQRILLLLLLFYLVNQGIAEVFAQLQISNFPFFHLSVTVETILLGWVFFTSQGTFHNRRIQLGATLVFAFAAVLNAVVGEGLWNAPAILLTISSVLLTLMVALYFAKVFRELAIARVEREFLFWVALGILFFFLGTLLLSTFINFLTQRRDVYFDVFIIRAILIIACNLCYSIALLCKALPPKSSIYSSSPLRSS